MTLFSLQISDITESSCRQFEIGRYKELNFFVKVIENLNYHFNILNQLASKII